MRIDRRRLARILAAAPLLSGCAPFEGSAGAWLLGALAAMLVLLAAGAGYLAARLQCAGALQAARDRDTAQDDLSGEIRWSTDAAQRIGDWQAPTGWPPGAPGVTLFDCFDAGAQTDALRQALNRAAPFGPVPARAASDGSPWLLSARPITDLDGRPSGHAGVARPAPRAGEAASLRAWLEISHEVVVIVERDADRWVMHAATAAGRQFIGGGDASGASVLPAALTKLLDAAPDAVHDAEGWRLAPFREGQRRGFVLSRAADGGDGGDTAAFSYTVSHDLRAPIRVVEGFTRIVKEDYGHALDRVGNDHLERVLGAAARMNQMIDAMLTLARLSSQPLARQPVNLSQIAGYVVDELRRAAPERAAEVEIADGLTVTGDPTLLRLVLENLIGNAWKYTARRPLARIVFAREDQDGRAIFVVRDNGAGFDMRSADRLFGLFQRLHSANDFPGTGVGLASVRRIIRRHGGEIWADAEPGKGAAFHFTLGA